MTETSQVPATPSALQAGQDPSAAGRLPKIQLAGAVVAIVVVALIGARLSVTTIMLVENILVLGLFGVATNLLLGYGGLVSFGQAAFFGIGSYVIALNFVHLDLPFWVAFVAAPVIGALVAVPVGALALRTRQLYFALITLAFSQLFTTIAHKWYSVTKGDNGIFGAMLPPSLAEPRAGFMFVLAVVVVALVLLWKVTVSPFGMALRATRENRERAASLGINVYRHQLVAFVISGFFCSLAGALLAVHDEAAYPQLLDWTMSGIPIFAAVIGGMYAFLGPVVGAAIYQLGHDLTVRYTDAWQFVLGIVLLAVVLFAPDGVATLFRPRRWWAWLRTRRTRP